MEQNSWKLSTRCVHAGTQVDPIIQGVNTPIHTSSSYGYLDFEENQYPRYFNVANQKALVDKIKALEEGEDALVFSSGMGAITCILMGLLKNGDHAVFQKGLYGGTQFFAGRELKKYGIDFTVLEKNGVNDFEDAIRPNTKIIYIESPSNPLLEIMNVKAIARLGKEQQIITVIDNTFASPINQNPLKMGIDMVLHSGTKYLGGHGDLCFGTAISSKQLIDQIRPTAVNFGMSLNALTCYLIERSMKTLHIRVQKQNQNAIEIARFLNQHDSIKKVHYPGLQDFPGHDLAKEQMLGYGGMMAFELSDTVNADSFLRRLKLIFPALSLGGVESIISSPAKTSHIKLTSQQREAMGISDQLLRLSVGIEDSNDLIRDLDQALG